MPEHVVSPPKAEKPIQSRQLLFSRLAAKERIEKHLRMGHEPVGHG